MSRGALKNCVILLLIVLAAWQTGTLWFSNTAGRSWLNGMLSGLLSAPDNNEKSLMVIPARLIKTDGDNVFYIQYNGLRDSAARGECDAFIRAALKDGEFMGSKPVDYAELLGSESVIYDYAFDIPSDVFADAFGQRNAGIAGRCAVIRSAHLYAAKGGEGAKAVFFDGKTVYEYRVKEDLRLTGGITSDLYYEASALGGKWPFEGNVFIPRYVDGTYAYPSVQVTNPYAAGDRLRTEIEKKVAHLFANPAMMIPYTSKDNVYTFSDDSAVVKYYQNDVLDYANYKAEQSGGSVSVTGYYSVAVNFIMGDSQVRNETFLAGCEQDDKRVTYFFDYAINNLPVIIPDSYKNGGDSAISHALEVTVAEGKVVAYKKIVYNFSLDYGAGAVATVDFDEFWSGAAGEGGESLKNAGVALGFRIDRKKQAPLYWVLSVEGFGYSVSAQ